MAIRLFASRFVFFAVDHVAIGAPRSNTSVTDFYDFTKSSMHRNLCANYVLIVYDFIENSTISEYNSRRRKTVFVAV